MLALNQKYNSDSEYSTTWKPWHPNMQSAHSLYQVINIHICHTANKFVGISFAVKIGLLLHIYGCSDAWRHGNCTETSWNPCFLAVVTNFLVKFQPSRMFLSPQRLYLDVTLNWIFSVYSFGINHNLMRSFQFSNPTRNRKLRNYPRDAIS